jgi:cytochrome P450
MIMNKTTRNELKVYLYSHPFALAFAETVKVFGSVVRIPGIGYIVNDPAIGKEILSRDKDFNKSGPGSMGTIITQVMGDYALLNMDGCEHRHLRNELKDLFSPEASRTLVHECFSEELDWLKSELEQRRSVELVEFMEYVTGKLIYHFLGATVPSDQTDRDFYREQYRRGQKFVEFMRLTTKIMSKKQVTNAREQLEQLTAPVMASYSEFGVRENSIASRLFNMGLETEKIKALVSIFLMVGTESVTTAVPRIMAILVDSTEIVRLQERPELLPTAIDEGLRMVAPSPAMLRSVSRDCEVKGHLFKADKRVVLLTYNMLKNRDFYPRPRRFSLERTHDPTTKNLWFGAGSHFCLGFTFALNEIQSVLSVILDIPGTVQITNRKVDRQALLPAYRKLEIVITAP